MTPDEQGRVTDLPRHRRRAAAAASRPDPLEVVATFSSVLRETLATGADRAELDGMLERLCHQLGYPSMVVARGDGDELELVASYGFPTSEERRGTRHAVTDGLTGRVFATGAPVRCDDTRDEPAFLDVAGGRHRSFLGVPMRLVHRPWGVLVVESPEPAAFDDDDVAILQPLADQMGWAFDAVRMHRIAEERARREARLRRGFEATAAVITAGLEATDRESALARMTHEVGERFDWGRMSVIVRDEADGVLRCVASHAADDAIGATIDEGVGIIGHVVATGRPYVAASVQSDPYYHRFYADTRSDMAAPLVVSGEVVGALNAEVSHRELTIEDLEILSQMAEQFSLVLHNLELLTKEKETVTRLHELDRLKSRLLTIASHELRTPLTVVLGFAEVLAEHVEQLTTERTQEYADAIVRQAQALSSTVDQMLLAAQMEQGQLSVQPTATDLLHVVARVLRGRLQDVEVLPGTDTRVLADPFRLEQVLGSLLDNAIKYAGDAGRIQIDARRQGGVVTILVRDEGPGIPKEERQAVFETFHQVGEHGIAGRRGIGLGLTVARDLLRLMDGELELATAEGYGATFTITLPATD